MSLRRLLREEQARDIEKRAAAKCTRCGFREPLPGSFLCAVDKAAFDAQQQVREANARIKEMT